MAHQLTTSYTKDARDLLRYYKRLGDRSIEQCPDEALFTALDSESNSIAIIVKHMAGNMRSRWTDFLTTDGEKPDRNRDSEFETPPQTRAGLVALWEAGWKICLDALDALTDADLARTITIRTEPHSVMQAINRQVGHSAARLRNVSDQVFSSGPSLGLRSHCSPCRAVLVLPHESVKSPRRTRFQGNPGRRWRLRRTMPHGEHCDSGRYLGRVKRNG